MSEWVATTLGDSAEILMGQSPPGDSYNLRGDGLPFMQGSAEFGEQTPTPVKWCTSPNKVAEPGDLLLSVRAPVGDTNFADQRIATGRGLAIVRAFSKTTNEFLRLTIQHTVGELLSRSGSGMFSSITAKELRGFPISLPSSVEQRRIVDAILAVDAQINALKEEVDRGAAVYVNATSLLWLDDDGVEAPSRPLADVMSLDVERLRLDDSSTYRSAGVLNAGQGIIDKGSFIGSQTEYNAMNVLRADQVVMRKLTAWEGPIAVVPPQFDGFVASNEFPTFTINEQASPQWMRHVCRTSRLWHEMKNRVTGTVQRRKRLNPDQLLEVSLPIPPREVQERVAHVLDALDQKVANLTDELMHLRSFRSALLTALLNQDIEIPESYDRLLEPATVGAD